MLLDLVHLDASGLCWGSSCCSLWLSVVERAQLFEVLAVVLVLESARLVDVLPFLCSIHAQEYLDGLFATWMFRDPVGDIVDIAKQDNPSIIFGLVLGDLIHLDARWTFVLGRRCRSFHAVGFQVLDLCDQLLLGEVLQFFALSRLFDVLCGLLFHHVVMSVTMIAVARDRQVHQVLDFLSFADEGSGGIASHLSGVDGVEERNSSAFPDLFIRHVGHLASGIEAIDGRAGWLQDLALLAVAEPGHDATKGSVKHRQHLGGQDLSFHSERLLHFVWIGSDGFCEGMWTPVHGEKVVCLIEVHEPLDFRCFGNGFRHRKVELSIFIIAHL
mmetsp:Transcript_125491/g.220987  ORF Transcript_125491/g.220987 Transcript_125491/m.220987 type:complete len:329 (-) Transcript_125491:503-1489(-)